MRYSLILLLIFASCASVKRASEETTIKDNSVSEVEATKYSQSYTIEPIDLRQPILIGKDTVYNTRVIYNNTKEIVKEKKENKIDLKEEKQTKEVDYSETIKAVSNRLIIAFFVLAILSFIYKKFLG